MPQVIDVNAIGIIDFSKKLDKMSKYALPIAVRRTLSSVAFETKKKTLPQEAAKAFNKRNASFYRFFSRAEPASGFNINRMKSKAGMFDNRKAKGSQAVGNQSQQQRGGTIGGRTFIPIDEARVGGKNNRNVRKANTMETLNESNSIKSAVRTEHISGSAQKKYIVGVAMAGKQGELLIHKSKKGRNILYRVTPGGGKFKIRGESFKIEPLYSIDGGRSVKIKNPVPFTEIAGKRAQLQSNKFFRKHATNALNRMR